MKLDRLKIYLFEIVLIIILFFALFAPNVINRGVIALILVGYTILLHYTLRKKGTISMYEKQVTWLMLIFSLVYLAVFYLLGLNVGFQKAKIYFSWYAIRRLIIPISLIIISSEIIRKKLLSQEIIIKIKKLRINLVSLLTFIAMVLIDLLIYTGVYDLTNLDDFLTAVGFVLFASISSNLLFKYISARYGSKGIIIFRLITVLYIYIIPVIPNVYLFFRIFLRMVYPYIMYLVLERSYSKKIKGLSKRQKRSSFIGNTIIFTIIILGIMLISCQFKYGILVIGSRSMTPTINIGDAVVFEQYKHQVLKKGDVIIFEYNGIQTVHRIDKISKVNGEYRYFTKGDANKSRDEDYRLIENIKGIVNFRIKYIGKPTLWLRSLF